MRSTTRSAASALELLEGRRTEAAVRTSYRRGRRVARGRRGGQVFVDEEDAGLTGGTMAALEPRAPAHQRHHGRPEDDDEDGGKMQPTIGNSILTEPWRRPHGALRRSMRSWLDWIWSTLAIGTPSCSACTMAPTKL